MVNPVVELLIFLFILGGYPFGILCLYLAVRREKCNYIYAPLSVIIPNITNGLIFLWRGLSKIEGPPISDWIIFSIFLTWWLLILVSFILSIFSFMVKSERYSIAAAILFLIASPPIVLGFRLESAFCAEYGLRNALICEQDIILTPEEKRNSPRLHGRWARDRDIK